MELLFLEEVDSTNKYAKEHIDELKDKTLIYTNRQYAGKGRLQRVWSDLGDENVFASIILKPSADMREVYSNLNLAKTFLKYCYTDKALKSFTETTGVPRNLQYDVDVTKLPSDYARSVWNMYKTSDVVVTASSHNLYLTNRLASSLILDSNFWRTQNSDLFYSALGKGTSAKDFFKGMWN